MLPLVRRALWVSSLGLVLLACANGSEAEDPPGDTPDGSAGAGGFAGITGSGGGWVQGGSA
ncbi:MAG: ferritin-like domain-containing protein, partial [Polyangiaceae bacterium]|nr:ferritin-like domain-containing protein [Polyangiaceae bacterium]